MLQQTFHIDRCLFPLGFCLAGGRCFGGVHKCGHVLLRCIVKGRGLNLFALLGQALGQLDLIVPVLAQVVVRQKIGSALGFVQKGKIRLANHGVVEFVDQRVVTHGVDPVVRQQGHIHIPGVDDQGIHFHQTEKA